LVHEIVFWAVLVIVPLGLSVIAEERGLYKLLVFAQPVAALFTIASFFVQKGPLSAVLACLYAYSLATHTLIITIPGMAMTHGLLNAFGFVTCSLLVWTQRVVDFPQ